MFLELVSWKKGLETVYLIEAVRNYSTGSLTGAKEVVERFLGGECVKLTFRDRVQLEAFSTEAEKLGVTIRS